MMPPEVPPSERLGFSDIQWEVFQKFMIIVVQQLIGHGSFPDAVSFILDQQTALKVRKETCK